MDQSPTITQQQLEIRPCLTADDLLLWKYRGTSDRLVVCFSGVGDRPSELPTYNFVQSASNFGRDSVLFVVDPRRSWLNGAGLIEKLVQQIHAFKREIHAKSVCMLGHSMGGFAALVMPYFTPVKVAIGFSPQFSVHPDVAGDDHRWMEYREKIENFRIRSMADFIVPETVYQVFHGRHYRERPQRDRFPFRENLQHHIFPNTVHNVPSRLKQHNLLETVISLCFQDKKRELRKALRPLRAYRRNAKDNPILGPNKMVTHDKV